MQFDAAHHLPSFAFIYLFIFISKICFADEILAEPKIAYMDGNQPWDDCRPGLKRSLNGLTGLLISHREYGSAPYNSSRNCFLTIAVPVGYRVRLKALDLDVHGQWRRCEEEDTLHVFDHHRPLEPHLLAAEEPLPIGGHSPGKILGEFCGKMPAPDSKGQKHFVLAESSQNALTLWWHSEPQKEEEKQNSRFQQTSTAFSAASPSSPFAQGYRLLWSSFRHVAPNEGGGQCRPKSNASGFGEFQCGGRSPPPSNPPNAPHPPPPFVECIPSPLGCNSHADCADASDLDARQQLRHGCQHIPNDPLSLLTSSGPKRLLLVAALVLLWLSLCLGCSCCLVHQRRRRQKTKRRIIGGGGGSKKKQQQYFVGHQNGRQNGAGEMEGIGEERGQMIMASNPPPLHPFSFASTFSSSGHPHQHFPVPPPPLPPPSFSPPDIPTNRPPPAPANIGNSQQRQFHPQQQIDQSQGNGQSQNQKCPQKRQQQSSSASAAGQSHSQQSSSSSSHSHQPILPFGNGPPLPPPHLTNGGGTEAPNSRLNNLPPASSEEYFYVHKTGAPLHHVKFGGGQQQQRQQHQHLLL